ncbi:TetR/AcrR family transcriptional regulator [Desulforamulus ruminis]|uniref:Tetracycline transcriptional regulator QacR-related domain-containing protein n=1 Tax=Desulforamulus ruminis (strain ATCC 23193 / DSM 2154 / NCIMB 8452 / DL) TaxID=696281 RepID=F6DK89_DESRL|nr:TetR/AcrR family transcriptional regulator [Desulforamulus ruminis]AEG61506.1 Tetracycline transcriptional regulator QacR-related domain-containing protein [Desulforamulus ruminis DSM 2154]
MSKRRLEGEQTKKHIINKAKILFAQKGYAGTSIEDICAAAECSKGSIYYHFKNKEELFLYLAEQTFKESWEQWEKISSQCESVTEKLYGFGDYFVSTLQRPLNKAGEEFISRVGADSEIGQKFFAIMNNFMKDFEKLVSKGISKGEFKKEDPKELAFIILSFYSGLSDSYLFMDKEAMKRLFQKGTTLLLQGISNSKET